MMHALTSGSLRWSERFQNDNFPYKMLVVSILLYFWGSELYTFFPFSPNVVMGVLVVLSLLAVYAGQLTYRRVLLICYLALLLLYTSVVTTSVYENFSNGIRIITLLLLLALLADSESIWHLERSIRELSWPVGITAVVFALFGYVELCLPTCYSYGDGTGGWGYGKYFLGFTSSSHMAASNSILLLVLVLLYVRCRRFSAAELILVASPVLMVLQSGARTYLVPLICILATYYVFRLKGERLKVILIPVIVIAVAYATLNTGMLDKFNAVGEGLSGSDDFLFSFTNSRTFMYDGLMVAYSDMSDWQKVFGAGFTFAEESIEGKGAHNDVLYMLLSAGIIGACVYCATVVGLLLGVARFCGSGRPRFVSVLGLAAYILFPALLNGLYNNPHLLFSVAFFTAYLFGAIAPRASWQGTGATGDPYVNPQRTRSCFAARGSCHKPIIPSTLRTPSDSNRVSQRIHTKPKNIPTD